MLKQIAKDLMSRASGDQRGGWSTNHVEPMKKLSDEIAAHIGRGGSDTDPTLIRRVATQLDRLAIEVTAGGWSTQNLDYFKTQANKLFAHLGRR